MSEMSIKQHEESMDPAHSSMIDHEGAPYFAFLHDKDHPHHSANQRSSLVNSGASATERKKQQELRKRRAAAKQGPGLGIQEDHAEATEITHFQVNRPNLGVSTLIRTHGSLALALKRRSPLRRHPNTLNRSILCCWGRSKRLALPAPRRKMPSWRL
jgi:hypothetical protein